MKKNIFLTLAAGLALATSCVNVNDNFDLSGAKDVDNVIAVEEDFAGKYPSEGYFSSKADMESAISTWLMGKYLACDAGSTAKISVKYGPKEYVLTSADYDSMGEEKGQPGKYDNFDSKMDVDAYITAFLTTKYPEATEGEVRNIGYKFYQYPEATDMARVYEFADGAWKSSLVKPQAEAYVAVMEFAGYAKGWSLTKLVGSVIAFTMEEADYAALLDWVKTNKAEKGSNGQGYIDDRKPDDITSEYWFGASVSYKNINNKINTWKNYYNPDGYLDNLSDEEIYALMEERLQWGIANLVLPRLVETPSADATYEVHYTLYADKTTNPFMTFKWNEEGFYFVSGPTVQ